MTRYFLSALFFLLWSATSVLAADTAERRIIGFSPDGKWFAFEQFGVQDGSGFPYHDVFVIDLINDKWAPDTPVHIRIDDETATPFQAWKAARVKAAPILAKRKIIRPGLRLVSNPSTEISATPGEVSFYIHPSWTGPQVRHTLSLEAFTVPKPEDCAYTDGDTRGFALKLKVGEGPPVEVYRDTSIPKSRHCALNYAISDIVIDEESQKPERFVVIIYVFVQGFEGIDARFIALPVAMP